MVGKHPSCVQPPIHERFTFSSCRSRSRSCKRYRCAPRTRTRAQRRRRELSRMCASQADAMADDIEIDLEKMSLWSKGAFTHACSKSVDSGVLRACVAWIVACVPTREQMRPPSTLRAVERSNLCRPALQSSRLPRWPGRATRRSSSGSPSGSRWRSRSSGSSASTMPAAPSPCTAARASGRPRRIHS